ncbi:DUF2523 domain-containing protein [Aquabacterium sp. CECT 9606]|uniref:DUF2523 domain-containing protein n=1 Tax=Aquabacterium sp. CECT 9606 TaxID=2845822 RepID=UPI001E3DA852|nr:DUF2523 domain-containing protein [Aquabacterium sp. CECT 9606]CAH0354786.1 hypothetical protein AQB9606_03940 [Aquabacterium sp. CECT 9606]
MPVFLSALVGALVSAVGTIVGRVLVSLGIAYVTYQGLNASLEWLKSQVASNMGSLPSEALQVLSALQVGAGLSVILSAFAARLVLSGLTSDSLKKMVLK